MQLENTLRKIWEGGSIREVRQTAGTDTIPVLPCQSIMAGDKWNDRMCSMHLRIIYEQRNREKNEEERADMFSSIYSRKE